MIEKSVNVKASFNRGVEKIERTSRSIKVYDTNQIMEEFDEIVFACDAETALKLLGNNQATFAEKKVLGKEFEVNFQLKEFI
jgi:predicted NAD/FAD-binding protein